MICMGFCILKQESDEYGLGRDGESTSILCPALLSIDGLHPDAFSACFGQFLCPWLFRPIPCRSLAAS